MSANQLLINIEFHITYCKYGFHLAGLKLT